MRAPTRVKPLDAMFPGISGGLQLGILGVDLHVSPTDLLHENMIFFSDFSAEVLP